MNSTIDIKNDGINIYATLKVKANRTGKIALFAVIVVFSSVFILIGSSVKTEDGKSLLFPFVLIFLLVSIIPIGYFIWNLFGSESLIVNSKTISYQYNYGIFKTNLKSINYEVLGVSFARIRTENETELGKIIFYNYREKDNLPEFVHQTSVLLSKEDLKRLENEISGLFRQEKPGFIPYSKN